MKSKILLAFLAIALGGLMLTGTLWTGKAMTVRAVEPNQSIVDRLVARFNLNQDEVKGVFDEEQQARQEKMQAEMESRLDEAVKDGVITAEQKEALLKKQTEWQEKEKQLREEKQKWMEESGIDFEKLAQYRVGLGGFGGPGGMRGGPGGP